MGVRSCPLANCSHRVFIRPLQSSPSITTTSLSNSMQFLENFGTEVKASKLMLKTRSRIAVDGFWGTTQDLQAGD